MSSPVDAVVSHRTPIDSGHFEHAQNKCPGNATLKKCSGVVVWWPWPRSKVSYKAVRPLPACTKVFVQTPWSSVAFAQRCYKVKKLKTNLPSGWLSLALPGAVLRSSNDDDADILISRISPFSRPVGSRQSEKMHKHKHALANNYN